MAKGCDTGVKAETIGEDVLNIIGTDGLEIGIMCAFCYYHYGLAFSDLTVLDWARSGVWGRVNHTQGAYPLNNFTHLVLPRICRWWAFGDEDKICARAGRGSSQ